MNIEAIVSAIRSAAENNSAIEASKGEAVLFYGVKRVKIKGNTVIICFADGSRAEIGVSVIERRE